MLCLSGFELYSRWVSLLFLHFTLPAREANFKKQIRYIMWLLLGIIILFAVCWLPVHMLHCLIFFYEDIYSSLAQSYYSYVGSHTPTAHSILV